MAPGATAALARVGRAAASSILPAPRLAVNRRAALAGPLALAVLLAACGQAARAPTAAQPSGAPGAAEATAPPAAPAKLTMSYSNLTPDQWPIFLAQDLGLFAKHGIDMDLRQIDSSTGVAALIAGETQAAGIGGSEVMSAAAEGADLVIIAGLTKTFSFRFMAPETIRTVDDLRGKRVGVSRIGSSSDIATRLALQRLGLQPNKDVEIIQVGSLSARIQALQSGAIQGGVAQPPDTARLAKTGMHVLFDVSDLDLPNASSVIAVRRADLTGQRAAMQALVDTMVDAVATMRDDPKAAKETLGKWIQLDDPDALQEAWEFYTQKIIPTVPRVEPAQLETAKQVLMGENPRLASYDPTQLIDNSLVDAAAARAGAR
ncbi:MAG TPA: ABC transporter substrate-binding protein [Chloroflexota bacterium]|nr:ABC transporter substrate-binding protein [Chloroflexota bacterium]